MTLIRGRFAPSPSGPLHFGSLTAALGSWLTARQAGGEWLLRIEDIDPPREKPGAADAILRTLEASGLHWDGAVLYQSRRQAAYLEALEKLVDKRLAYPCACSRKEVAQSARRGAEGPIYAGRCRNGIGNPDKPPAVRLRVEDEAIGFEDRVVGWYQQNLAVEIGDFVIRRADGLFAYQLAVVVDDAFQGINQVVRGADLLSSTPRQILLQNRLGLPRPAYVHLPLALDRKGRKLSKSDQARPLDDQAPLPSLLTAWAFLGQHPPEAPPGSTEEFLAWAIKAWDLSRVAASAAPAK